MPKLKIGEVTILSDSKVTPPPTKSNEYKIEVSKYANGIPAIVLLDDTDGQVAVLSTNLPGSPYNDMVKANTNKNKVWFIAKLYSENEQFSDLVFEKPFDVIHHIGIGPYNGKGAICTYTPPKMARS
jgi:hypothetical protein